MLEPQRSAGSSVLRERRVRFIDGAVLLEERARDHPPSLEPGIYIIHPVTIEVHFDQVCHFMPLEPWFHFRTICTNRHQALDSRNADQLVSGDSDQVAVFRPYPDYTNSH